MFTLTIERKKTHTNSKVGYGEIFNSLHFFLINSVESNIAWNYYQDINSFIFYSTEKEDLTRFMKFIRDQDISVFDSKINNHKKAFKSISVALQVVNNIFIIKDITETEYDQEGLILLQKVKSPNNRISLSTLLKKIDYLNEFKETDTKKLSQLNLKLSRLFKLMNIKSRLDLEISNSDSEDMKHKKISLLSEIKLRMNKRSSVLSIPNIYLSNQKTFKNTLFFKEVENHNKVNFKTNRYGLSTNEFIFPINGI